MIRKSYPGKLFLMGEYAVLNTNHKSVITSVNRFLHVDLVNQNIWEIKSSFGHFNGADVFSMKTMPEVSAALRTVEDFLQKPLKSCKLTIVSQLDEGDKKYGFGSSGVVIVAVVSAVLENEGIVLDSLSLFKLCVLVQKEMGNLSSGGDLAASIYQDVIIYTRYDKRWLLNQVMPLSDLISQEWPHLLIEKLALKKTKKIVIGWTQKSNKTDNYTRAVDARAKVDPMSYRAFLVSSQKFVNDFIDAVHDGDDGLLYTSIAQYREIMVKLGEWSRVDIETDELRRLIETSLSMGFAAKVSGSGGGDCGFALVPINQEQKIEALKNKWFEDGIILVEE